MSERVAYGIMIEEKVMDDKSRGLYDKFNVIRVDGRSMPGQKHYGCEYFVLDLDHDEYAIAAIKSYARKCKKQYPRLAMDLEKRAAKGIKS